MAGICDVSEGNNTHRTYRGYWVKK